jgi:hypothetical protein
MGQYFNKPSQTAPESEQRGFALAACGAVRASRHDATPRRRPAVMEKLPVFSTLTNAQALQDDR